MEIGINEWYSVIKQQCANTLHEIYSCKYTLKLETELKTIS